MIRGRVLPHEDGARVDVTMFMHPFVFCFMVFWCGTLGWGIWTYPSDSLVPAIMLLFGLGLSVGGFYWEVSKAKRLLSQVLLNSEIAASERLAPTK